MSACYAHLYKLYTNFGFAGAAQRTPKLVNVTVLTMTLDIRMKCASAFFVDAERNVTLHAEQDCMCCALMSDSSADCRMTVLL